MSTFQTLPRLPTINDEDTQLDVLVRIAGSVDKLTVGVDRMAGSVDKLTVAVETLVNQKPNILSMWVATLVIWVPLILVSVLLTWYLTTYHSGTPTTTPTPDSADPSPEDKGGEGTTHKKVKGMRPMGSTVVTRASSQNQN